MICLLLGFISYKRSVCYFYQRWYDPVIGRFMSESPLGRMAEHLYGFCNNNPVMIMDPLGLVPSDDSGEVHISKTCYDKCKSLMMEGKFTLKERLIQMGLSGYVGAYAGAIIGGGVGAYFGGPAGALSGAKYGAGFGSSLGQGFSNWAFSRKKAKYEDEVDNCCTEKCKIDVGKEPPQGVPRPPTPYVPRGPVYEI